MNYLTKEQVTENLQKYFPDKNGICIDAFEDFIITGKFNSLKSIGYTYLIEFRNEVIKKILIDSKKVVWVLPTDHKMNDYENFCTGKKMFIKRQFKDEIFIPYVWDKKTMEEKQKAELQSILICVGYAKQKVEKTQTIFQKIKSVTGQTYVDIYKLIQELEITGHSFDENYKLKITHTKGSFSFYPELIAVHFFCELLNCKNPYLTSEPGKKGNIKTMNFCKRLKTIAA